MRTINGVTNSTCPRPTAQPCVRRRLPVYSGAMSRIFLSGFSDLKARLARSRFRSRFHLSEADKRLVARDGWDAIERAAERFVRERLAPAAPKNDGRQTPMRGHPVFVAQHATGCCCRGCLAKWHGIAAGRELSDHERAYVVSVLLAWMRGDAGDLSTYPTQGRLL